MPTLATYTRDMTPADLLDLAAECEGDTAQTVEALIAGVLARCGDLLDEASHAALNAVAYYHVPTLQDALHDLESRHHANRET